MFLLPGLGREFSSSSFSPSPSSFCFTFAQIKIDQFDQFLALFRNCPPTFSWISRTHFFLWKHGFLLLRPLQRFYSLARSHQWIIPETLVLSSPHHRHSRVINQNCYNSLAGYLSPIFCLTTVKHGFSAHVYARTFASNQLAVNLFVWIILTGRQTYSLRVVCSNTWYVPTVTYSEFLALTRSLLHHHITASTPMV